MKIGNEICDLLHIRTEGELCQFHAPEPRTSLKLFSTIVLPPFDIKKITTCAKYQ